MRLPPIASAIVLSWLAAGCGGGSESRGAAPVAAADLRDAAGRDVGMAQLSEEAEGVRILLEVHGLPPGAKGVHIHESGSCEAPDFKSAGGHFNPEGKQHGLENPRGPHAGDLPNLEVKQDGTGRLDATDDRITLGSGPGSLFDADGSALVIHADRDDQKTDPAGNSGDRLVCGVIVKG